jgi:hypothetical protein
VILTDVLRGEHGLCYALLNKIEKMSPYDVVGICTLGRAGQRFLRRGLRSGRVFASSNAAFGT